MKKLVILSATTLLLAYSLSGYSRPPGSNAEISTAASLPSAYTACHEPRPEICYEIYAPVCATRDTGIRCVTTPCPQTEKVTFSNGCTACADNRVKGYDEGECPSPNL